VLSKQCWRKAGLCRADAPGSHEARGAPPAELVRAVGENKHVRHGIQPQGVVVGPVNLLDSHTKGHEGAGGQSGQETMHCRQQRGALREAKSP